MMYVQRYTCSHMDVFIQPHDREDEPNHTCQTFEPLLESDQEVYRNKRHGIGLFVELLSEHHKVL
jgi:hypothetical protein